MVRQAAEPGPRPAVVVTGASSGIGRALARVAAREGCAVVLVARSPGELQAVSAEVREAGGEPFPAVLDLLAPDAPARLEAFLSGHGLVCDVLVNCAGMGLYGAAAAVPTVEQLGVVDLNVRAVCALTLHFLPGMRVRQCGGVINFSSVAGFVAGPYMAAYYASKAFVHSFSAALHQELRHAGVTVTCIAPGPVRTGFFRAAGAHQVLLFKMVPRLDPEFVAERAWRGFKARRRLVVPGLSSKVAMAVASLVPSAVMLPLIGYLQRDGGEFCLCGSGKRLRHCCGRGLHSAAHRPRSVVRQDVSESARLTPGDVP